VQRELLLSGAEAVLPDTCAICVAAKQTRVPRAPPQRRTLRPLERNHVDLMGPVSPAGRRGERYVLVATCEA
jgi:hypothetical protein